MSTRRTRRPTVRSVCAPPPHNDPISTLEEVVDRYIHDYRAGARQEMAYFAGQPSLQRAIELAAMSITETGKRHPHQRRIPRNVLKEAKHVLQSVSWKGLRSFHQLHNTIANEIGSIRGIGDLTVYDIATRIGAHLGLEPEYVYLHAGTRAGARALGFSEADYLAPAVLPPAFHRLKPHEIEDCLCIYKGKLRRAAA